VFDANGVVLAHFYACLTARLLSRTPDWRMKGPPDLQELIGCLP
jgi:hypothetical protein